MSKTKMMPGLELGVLEVFFWILCWGEKIFPKENIQQQLGVGLKDEEEGIYEPHLDLSLPFGPVKCLVFQPTSRPSDGFCPRHLLVDSHAVSDFGASNRIGKNHP